MDWRTVARSRAGSQANDRAASSRLGCCGLSISARWSSGWLGLAAAEICDKRVWLEDIWGRTRREKDAATLALGPNPSIAALQGVLSQWTGSKPLPDAEMMSVYRLFSEGPLPEFRIVPWLMAELGVSERTLRRRFEAAFGYGPKTLHRILRFQRYFKLAGVHEPNLIGRSAAASSYADQSHLVRECQRLALCTPSHCRDQELWSGLQRTAPR